MGRITAIRHLLVGLFVSCVGVTTYAEAQIIPPARDIDAPAELTPQQERLALTQDRIRDLARASDTIVGNTIANLPLNEQCRIQRERAENAAGHQLNAFGCIWTYRLNLRTPQQATQYFGGFGVGNAIGFSLGNDQAALYTELLSDNIYLTTRLGYARVGFATQVSASAEDTAATTVNQFFQGGGNALVYAALPLRVRITYADDRTNATPVRRFDSAGTLSIGADIPTLSVPATESASYVRLGLQTVFTWRTAADAFRFFILTNGGYTYGFTDSFYENLARDPDIDAPNWGILAGTGTVGVDLAQMIRVGVRFGSSTFAPAQQKPQLTVQVLARP